MELLSKARVAISLGFNRTVKEPWMEMVLYNAVLNSLAAVGWVCGVVLGRRAGHGSACVICLYTRRSVVHAPWRSLYKWGHGAIMFT